MTTTELEAALEKSEQRRKALGIALLEITKGEAKYVSDPLKHAHAIISKMVQIAMKAIHDDREASK